jgi:hypothetical protein
MVSRLCCALLFFALGTAAAGAQTEIGIEGAIVAGSHVGEDNPTPVSGVVPGALLEITQKWNGFRLHLEGIPQVGAAGTNSGAFGHSSATLSILNATAMVDLDKNHRIRVGGGVQLINLHNFNGNNGDTNYARATSGRYEVAATLPIARDRFVELSAAVLPNVRASLGAYTINNLPEANKPELGAEVDYSAGYGWKRGGTAYIVGVRGLSYHTRNGLNGALVDSNVGGGVTFEVRFPVLK